MSDDEEVYCQVLHPSRFWRVVTTAPLTLGRRMRRIARDADGEWVVFDFAEQHALATRVAKRLRKGPAPQPYEVRQAGDVILMRWRAEANE